MAQVAGFIGRWLARFLAKPVTRNTHVALAAPEDLLAVLQPADVLLVEGNTRVSVAIKYLTQSTWSHAALYIGDALGVSREGEAPRRFVEADLNEGVRAVPLAEFAGLHTRICRASGLTPEDRARVVRFAIEQIGHRYDLKNIIDLARYLLPTPPVPTRLRRRMLALGSGDPTRAICSTLIAQAFQSVRYPILPEIREQAARDVAHGYLMREIWHIRHHSLFAPRDFDISPYFEIVKPRLARGFDYRAITWSDATSGGSGAG